jgi:hypothetical protein
MYSFELLEKDCYYIVQLQQTDVLTLIQVKVISDNCMYVIKYNETAEMQWVKKTDFIFDIIECLSDEAAQQWFNVYNNSEDASYYEEDEE